MEILKERALRACDEYVMAAWIKEVKRKGPCWVECSKLLAGYGMGKPVQPLSGEDGDPIKIESTVIILPSNGREVKA